MPIKGKSGTLQAARPVPQTAYTREYTILLESCTKGDLQTIYKKFHGKKEPRSKAKKEELVRAVQIDCKNVMLVLQHIPNPRLDNYYTSFTNTTITVPSADEQKMGYQPLVNAILQAWRTLSSPHHENTHLTSPPLPVQSYASPPHVPPQRYSAPQSFSAPQCYPAPTTAPSAPPQNPIVLDSETERQIKSLREDLNQNLKAAVISFRQELEVIRRTNMDEYKMLRIAFGNWVNGQNPNAPVEVTFRERKTAEAISHFLDLYRGLFRRESNQIGDRARIHMNPEVGARVWFRWLQELFY
jgi:hypothetical protein